MATFAIYSIFAPKKNPNLFIYLFMQQLIIKKPNKFQDKSSFLLELEFGKFGFYLECSLSSKKGLT